MLDERSFFRDWRSAVKSKMIRPQRLRSKVQIYVRSRDRLAYIWTKESTMQQYNSERALKPRITLEETTSLYADQSDLSGVRTKQAELCILAKWTQSLVDAKERIRNSPRYAEIIDIHDENFRKKKSPK